MAEPLLPSPPLTDAAPSSGPRLETVLAGRPVSYDLGEAGFLIGTVPGCDVRLPGTGLPPLLCLVATGPEAVSFRKLAAGQSISVNGQAPASNRLADGDRLMVAGAEFVLRAPPPALRAEAVDQAPAVTELEEVTRLLDVRQEQLEAQARELECDKALWYRRRQEIEQECRRLAGPPPEALADLERQKKELQTLREELSASRKQLYDNYRQRRDRLALLQDSVHHAARKVQERKRLVDEEVRQAAARQKEDAARRAELDSQMEELTLRHKALEARAEDLAHRADELEDQQHEVEARRRETAQRLEQCAEREHRLDEERRALERQQAEMDLRHQEDLARLDRLQAVLEKREEQLKARALEADRRHEELTRTTRDLEEQARELEQGKQKLAGDGAKVQEQSTQLAARQQELARRAAAVEEQQAGLAALRTRLERTREEVRQEEQRLTRQREAQEQAEKDLRRRLAEAQRLRADLEHNQEAVAGDQQTSDERLAGIERAVEEMAQLQQLLDAQKEQLREQAEEHQVRMAAWETQENALRERMAACVAAERRLETERQALKSREAEILRIEQTRESLQEQLQRRGEELSERQAMLSEQERRRQADAQALAERQQKLEEQRAKATQELASYRQALEQKAGQLKQKWTQLSHSEQEFRRRVEALKTAGRKVSAARKALAHERSRWQSERQEEVEASRQQHARLAQAHEGLEGLRRQLPELELRARAAAEGLARAREQLRQHLAEIHGYARQSYQDLEELRGRAQEEGERLRRQAEALYHDRAEHRLSVAAFRQQLSEWQARLAEMRSTLVHDDTRLTWRKAEVEADTARLARQAEDLEVQEREVAQQREDMGRHLSDMREWYRRKLRELSQERSDDLPDDSTAETPVQGDVLALRGDLDPADRKLGELLCSLELIDSEALTALLLEAWKRRQSLREILLASGCITLYQLSLIEADNLDGLILGPVRVLDRLRVTPHEVVYRVFDPRSGGDAEESQALLRHLAESEAKDADRRRDFCQRFAACRSVRHPNVQATREVLEVAGRPAVLQEWLAGSLPLEANGLAAVPGVWFRLVRQAALGLQAIHSAGLVHGCLRSELLLLTADGILKVCGYAEPAWLAGTDEPSEDLAADLVGLGRVASAWAASAPRRKGAKLRPPPRAVQDILDGLGAHSGEPVYADVAALLEDLDRLGAAQPANPEAWERLLRHIRTQTEDVALRQSA